MCKSFWFVFVFEGKFEITKIFQRHWYNFVGVVVSKSSNVVQVQIRESERQCFHRDISIKTKPGIERVQALTDISRSALCCHSNEIRAPIANPPNSAQLGATLTIPKITSRSVRSVRMRRGTDRQTDTQTHRHTDTQTAVATQYTFRLGYTSREM